MNATAATIAARFPAALALAIATLLVLAVAGCGADAPVNPRELLLAPEDFSVSGVTVLSVSEEQSQTGPSAQIELQGPGFQVLHSIVLYDTREQALAALDGIRADLVSRGEAGPGEVEASGIFEHRFNGADAASLVFIEDRGLARLTVTGSGRNQRLTELAAAARGKIADG